MKKSMARVIAGLLASLAAVVMPVVVLAHPLGNFTINRYSRIELGRDGVELRYVVDMAEIAAFQHQSRIDTNSDGTLSSDEQAAYATSEITALAANLHLDVNGQNVALRPQAHRLTFPAGQGGLRTMRLEIDFAAPLPEGTAWTMTYHDDSFPDRIGWREVVVRAGPGMAIAQASVPDVDRSQELHVYPQDMLQSPLAVTSATARFIPGTGSTSAQQLVAAEQARPADAFANLITLENMTPGAIMFALLGAFGLGAAHALAPGHGKTVVAAYLVGSRGTARHALFLGLTTTVTHTAGVFAFGIVTLFVSRFILPEQLYPWLGVVSGLLVFVLGATLLRGRLQTLLNTRRVATEGHDGLDPLAPHSHGGVVHTHAPPAQLGWRSLLALGVSGGLLPCPSALVVLLSAIALGRVGLGLILILAFSLGLASVLTAIGVVLVHATKLFARIPARGRLFQVLPVVSALVVLVLGAGISVQALLSIGVLHV